MPVDHLVVDTDQAVRDGGAQLVFEGSRHDHRLGDRFTGQRVNLAGVDDLVVHVEAGAADEGKAVRVVGHDHAEVVVARHTGAGVPHALDAEGGHVERRTALVGQVFLKAQDDVHGSKSVRQEGLGVLAQEGGIKRGDVCAQAANALLAAEAVLVEVAVGEPVAVGVVETQVRTVGLRLWERNQSRAWRQGRNVLTVLDTLKVGAFEDDVNQAA